MVGGYAPLVSRRSYGSPLSGLGALFTEEFFNDKVPSAAWERRNASAGRIRRLDDKTVYSFALPGVSVEELSVEVQDNVLTYSVERRSEDGGEEGSNRLFVESSSQSVSLDKNADVENIETDLSDGVLTVVVPKNVEADTSRKLNVSTNRRLFDENTAAAEDSESESGDRKHSGE